MKSYFFNAKEHDMYWLKKLSYDYNENYKVCIFYPNYNLTYEDYCNIFNNVNKKISCDITLIENENFKLENDYNIANVTCYNNININEIQKISNIFDVIIISRIIEHLTPNEYMYFLYNLKNLVSPYSKIVLTYPDMDFITNQIKKFRNKKSKLKIQDYILWNIELFNSESSNILDFHKMYTNEHIVTSLSEYESLYKVIETSNLFAINTPRQCYRTTILQPLTNEN